MNDQPDKLFRDKLLSYQKPVSAEAWNRIRLKGHGGGNIPLWMKIAAGVSFLVTAGYLVISSGDRDRVDFVSENTRAIQRGEAPAQTAPETQERNQPGREQKSGDTFNEPTPDYHPRPKPRQRVRPQNPATTTLDGGPTAVIVSEIQPISNPDTENSPMPAGLPVADAPSKTNGVTIVLTAEEVDEKYLLKKNRIVQATPEKEMPSSFRKMLDKAYDLKNNQDPIGSLRQKKNEILALNFRSNKERNENH